MKVICDRGALMDAINLVSGAVAARSPKPQLGCVKLVASKSGGAGELTLSATDAEIALRLSISQVDVQKAGEVLIPADKLRAIVSAEDGEPTLTLESDGEMCSIKGADAHFKVYGYPSRRQPQPARRPHALRDRSRNQPLRDQRRALQARRQAP
jgi:DNA polymerase-3 subunit beta